MKIYTGVGDPLCEIAMIPINRESFPNANIEQDNIYCRPCLQPRHLPIGCGTIPLDVPKDTQPVFLTTNLYTLLYGGVFENDDIYQLDWIGAGPFGQFIWSHGGILTGLPPGGVQINFGVTHIDSYTPCFRLTYDFPSTIGICTLSTQTNNTTKVVVINSKTVITYMDYLPHPNEVGWVCKPLPDGTKIRTVFWWN